MPASGSRGGSTRVLKGGPSKLRGVIWHKSNGKWEARIYETGKQRFLGYYTSEVTAARAYDARAVQLHGSAAKVNFPEDHVETRGNPPAVKAFSALSVPHASQGEGPRQKRRAPSRAANVQTAAARGSRRGDDGTDEDYVLPQQTRTRRGASTNMRPPSRRRTKSDEDDVIGSPIYDDDDDEASLEQGAVEVLASLFSGSEEGGSRRSSSGSATKWNVFSGSRPMRASSPPTASTGASPAPAAKSKVWMPSLWVEQDEGEDQSESCSRPPRTLQEARDLADIEERKLGGRCDPEVVEECVESRQDPQGRSPQNGGHRHFSAAQGYESSSENEEGHGKASTLPTNESGNFKGVTWNSTTQKWTAFIWDHQANKGRHIGTYDSELQAAHAYDREAVRLQHSSSALNFPDPHPHTATKPGGFIASAQSSFPGMLLRACQAESHGVANARQGGERSGIGRGALGAGKATRGSSRYRGVSWCEKGQKWRALLWDGNRQHFLGHFKSEEEGARAYDRALLQRKKKDGCLNFPLSDYQDPDPQCPSAGSSGKKRAREAGDADINASSPLQAPDQSAAAAGQTAPMNCTQQQPESMHGSTRFKGVSWSARAGKWKAQMWLGAKIVGLGYFDDEEAAARAYDVAVKVHRGPSAETNFPSESRAPDASLVMAMAARRAEGVQWHMSLGKWEAQIFNGLQQVSLGYYDTEVQASAAFKAAALQLRGALSSPGLGHQTTPGWNVHSLAAMAAAARPASDVSFPADWGSQKRRRIGMEAPCN